MSGDNKQFLSQQLLWIGISLGISLAISFLIPFPYSLPIIIAVFILLSFYVRKRSLKRMGMSGASMFGYTSLSLLLYELWDKTQSICVSEMWVKDEKSWILVMEIIHAGKQSS